MDHQERYTAIGGDLYEEWPLRGHDALTLQAGVIHYDGGRTFKTLHRQTDVLVEAGYEWRAAHAGPFVQFARQSVWSATAPDATSLETGVAFWPRGNRLSLKAAVGRTATSTTPARTQLLVQSQVFVF